MSNQQPIEINPTETHQLLHENTRSLLIDVRSSMEFLFVGHPTGAISIPWIDEPDWEVNPNFVREIKHLILGGSCGDKKHQPPILLICRSGKRSHEAGISLIESGILNVYNVVGGFEGERDEHSQRSTVNGWRFENLPWEQC
ncbi:MAG: rhodanese-like domain-containing protein [Pseudomonadota bacterium]